MAEEEGTILHRGCRRPFPPRSRRPGLLSFSPHLDHLRFAKDRPPVPLALVARDDHASSLARADQLEEDRGAQVIEG